MSRMRIKAVLVLLLVLASVALARAWRPTHYMADTRPKVNLESLFPRSFGEWRIDDRMPVQLISPDQAAMLNKIYNQTLSRTYVNSQGDRVMLSVAYGGDQSDGTRAHRPEVCYPAQGFQILQSRLGSVPLRDGSVPVRQLVARMGGRVEPITYWVIVGERVALSGTAQKLAQLGYTTQGVIPDGILMRVSTIDAEEARAYAVHGAFISAMYSVIDVQWRGFVFGSVSG